MSTFQFKLIPICGVFLPFLMLSLQAGAVSRSSSSMNTSAITNSGNKNVAMAASATTVTATGSNGSSVIKAPLADNKPEKFPLSFSWEMNRTTSLYDKGDGSRSDNVAHQVVLDYKFKNEMNFMVVSDYVQDLNKPEESGIQDLILILNHLKIWKGYLGELFPAVRVNLPVSKTERDVNEMIISGGPGMTYNSKELFGKYFSVMYKIYALKYDYKYSDDVKHKDLKQYEFRQYLVPQFAVGNWTLQFQFLHFEQWNFDGRPTQGAFDYIQELSYAINDHISLGVNHENAGAIYAEAGGMNTRLVDKDASVVGAKLAVSF